MVAPNGFPTKFQPTLSCTPTSVYDKADVDQQLRENMGLFWTEFDGQPLIERYMYPTLTIRGLNSGNTGELARNVIPSQAVATLGIRLAKGNDPDEMKDLVEDHIRDQGYHIVREDPDKATKLKYDKVAKVTGGGGYPAMRTPSTILWRRR